MENLLTKYSLNVFDSYILVNFKTTYITEWAAFLSGTVSMGCQIAYAGQIQVSKSRMSPQEELRLRDDQVAMRFFSLA